MSEIKDGCRTVAQRQIFTKIAVRDGRDVSIFGFLKFCVRERKLQPMDQLWSAPSSSELI